MPIGAREEGGKSRFVLFSRLKGQEGLPTPLHILLPVDRPRDSRERSNGPLGREPRKRIVVDQ